MDTEQCATCRFYIAGVLSDEIGVCRRHAPMPRSGPLTPQAAKALRRASDQGRCSLWPFTVLSDWCGEHETKPDEPKRG